MVALFFNEKLVPNLAVSGSSSKGPDPRFCWQGQHFRRVGPLRASFRFFENPLQIPSKMSSKLHAKSIKKSIEFFIVFWSILASNLAPRTPQIHWNSIGFIGTFCFAAFSRQDRILISFWCLLASILLSKINQNPFKNRFPKASNFRSIFKCSFVSI